MNRRTYARTNLFEANIRILKAYALHDATQLDPDLEWQDEWNLSLPKAPKCTNRWLIAAVIVMTANTTTLTLALEPELEWMLLLDMLKPILQATRTLWPPRAFASGLPIAQEKAHALVAWQAHENQRTIQKCISTVLLHAGKGKLESQTTEYKLAYYTQEKLDAQARCTALCNQAISQRTRTRYWLVAYLPLNTDTIQLICATWYTAELQDYRRIFAQMTLAEQSAQAAEMQQVKETCERRLRK